MTEVQKAIETVCAALRNDEFGGDYYASLSLASQLEKLAPAHIPLKGDS